MLPHVFVRGPAGVLSRCPTGDASPAEHIGSPAVVRKRNICQNITSYGLGRAVRNIVGLVAKTCKQQARLCIAEDVHHSGWCIPLAFAAFRNRECNFTCRQRSCKLHLWVWH